MAHNLVLLWVLQKVYKSVGNMLFAGSGVVLKEPPPRVSRTVAAFVREML